MSDIDPGEKLVNARCKLITTEPWYGSISARITWKEGNHIPTMGVYIVRGGSVICEWNPKFVDSLTQEQTIAVIKHEIEHVVRLHIVRLGSREPMAWNIATDSCINGHKDRPRVKDLPGDCVYMPDDRQLPINDDSTAEEVYDYVTKNRPKCDVSMQSEDGDMSFDGNNTTMDDSPDGDGNGGGGGKDEDDKEDGKDQKGGKGKKGKDEKDKKDGQGSGKRKAKNQAKPANAGRDLFTGQVIDDHSAWGRSTVGEDEARQVVKDMCEQASKQAGGTPGHLKDAVDALNDPVVSWRYLLRRYIGRKAGGKRKTYARRNRRYDSFGIKGRSSHASIPLTVIVDTSGSISKNCLQQFFAEIERMSQQFKITLLQFDVGLTDAKPYRRGDWKHLTIVGRGGTDVDRALIQAKEEGLLGIVNIALTDGYVSRWPKREEFAGVDILWCITTDVEPPWGERIQLPHL